jgi:glycine oxidase
MRYTAGMPRGNGVDDLLVAGGGIIGLAIAREAARAGLRVTLADAGEPGGEASSAAAGLLSPRLESGGAGPWLDLGLRSRDLYPDFAAAVSSESGLDPGLALDGVLEVARGPEEDATLAARREAQRALAPPAEPLAGAALRLLEPALADDVSAALLLPGDGAVDNAILVRGLAIAARRAGARILPRTRVLHIRLAGGAVAGAQTEAGPLRAGAAVIAAGAWSSRIGTGNLPPVPTHPVRGQIVALRAAPGLLKRPLHAADCYLVPRADGRVLVGSTMELAGFDRSTTPRALAALHAAAAALVPALARAPVDSAWAGLRPATADGLPAIGPGWARGLYYATGHLRNGILLAPLTARAVVRMVQGSDPGIDLGAVSPRRYSGARRASTAPPPERPRED